MGNEQGTGYAVLDLRMGEAEKDIRELRDDLRNHINQNDDEHKKMQASIAESNLMVREINFSTKQSATDISEMKQNSKESTERIEKKLEALGAKTDKESGWRAIIMDIIKIIFLLIGFIATGKWFL